jgi:hypothetical protein
VSAEVEHKQLTESMKRAAGVLRHAEIPFMLGGGLACWARGGPQTDHDVDFFVKPEDASRALDALAEAGMRTEHPAEDWLLKAYDGDVLIDLVFCPSGGEIDDDWFERAEDLEVLAARMCVASLEDVMTTKLLSLTEQEPDFSSVLEMGRMLREQIDWEAVRERTQASPFARAYFTLVEGLGIAEQDRAEARPQASIHES